MSNITNYSIDLGDLGDYDLNTATIYTSTGVNGTWSTTSGAPYNFSDVSSSSNWTKPSAKIQIEGKDADIIVNGRSLCQAIDAIEQRLGVLRPVPELEKDWDELKRLGDQYRALEAEIREKMQVWEVLKNTDNK